MQQLEKFKYLGLLISSPKELGEEIKESVEASRKLFDSIINSKLAKRDIWTVIKLKIYTQKSGSIELLLKNTATK